jgi:hypothetical protein
MPLGLMMLAFASCAEVNVDPLPSLYNTIPRGPRVAWSGIQSWMRQDNGCDFDHLERSRFDLMALAPRCVEGAALEHDDLARLKRSKWVLSYLDIARAAPAEPRAWPKLVNERSPFIAGPRTPWDSYPVDVTSDAWFRVLETIVRDDLARGYDGFWLDDCAGYWETRDANADAVRDHTNLVKRIRQLVNSIRPGVRRTRTWLNSTVARPVRSVRTAIPRCPQIKPVARASWRRSMGSWSRASRTICPHPVNLTWTTTRPIASVRNVGSARSASAVSACSRWILRWMPTVNAAPGANRVGLGSFPL